MKGTYQKMDYFWKIQKQSKGFYILKPINMDHEYSIWIYFDNYSKKRDCEFLHKWKYIQWINDCKTKKELIEELEFMLNNEHIFLEPFIS